MGYMKRFAEDVSVAVGLDGEINDDVLAIAQDMMDNGIIVRLAEDKDIEDVCRIVGQLSPENPFQNLITHDCQGAHQKFNENIQSSPDYFLWVAERNEDKKIVGTGMMHLQHKLSYRCGTAAHLEDVVVDEDHRGQHIGETILVVAVEAAKNLGCYKLMLTCYDKTASYYEQYGFARHDIGMRLSLKDEYEQATTTAD